MKTEFKELNRHYFDCKGLDTKRKELYMGYVGYKYYMDILKGEGWSYEVVEKNISNSNMLWNSSNNNWTYFLTRCLYD